MNKYFSVSGLVICFKSEKTIENSRLFSEFICEPAAPDVTVNIISGRLPETQAGVYKYYEVPGGKKRFSCKIKKADNEYIAYCAMILFVVLSTKKPKLP